jgi:hypothetical protein
MSWEFSVDNAQKIASWKAIVPRRNSFICFKWLRNTKKISIWSVFKHLLYKKIDCFWYFLKFLLFLWKFYYWNFDSEIFFIHSVKKVLVILPYCYILYLLYFITYIIYNKNHINLLVISKFSVSYHMCEWQKISKLFVDLYAFYRKLNIFLIFLISYL